MTNHRSVKNVLGVKHMICPKCYMGTIELVVLKMTGEEASLCEYCGTIWMGGEDIKATSGHPFDILTQGNSIEYIVEASKRQTQDETDIAYKSWK